MTNIEKWCKEHDIKPNNDLKPCGTIGVNGHCDICPWHFMDEFECSDECNAWGEKEATDD